MKSKLFLLSIFLLNFNLKGATKQPDEPAAIGWQENLCFAATISAICAARQCTHWGYVHQATARKERQTLENNLLANYEERRIAYQRINSLELKGDAYNALGMSIMVIVGGFLMGPVGAVAGTAALVWSTEATEH